MLELNSQLDTQNLLKSPRPKNFSRDFIQNKFQPSVKIQNSMKEWSTNEAGDGSGNFETIIDLDLQIHSLSLK